MKTTFLFLLFAALLAACNDADNKPTGASHADPSAGNLSALFENYYADRTALVPIESTQNGDSTHNDALYADFTDSYREKYRQFFSRYLDSINHYNRANLNEEDGLSYDIFKREMEMTLEGLKTGFFANAVTYPDHRFIPFNQFGGIPIWMGQQGSGEGSQPFKTVTDYEAWLTRAAQFSPWADSAIVYFRRGMAEGMLLPQALVKKMIPQLEAMVVTDATKSLFWGPVKKLPTGFTAADKQRLTASFTQLINTQLVPAYKRLADFLKTEYLPKARTTTGINAIPNGAAAYNYLIRFWTTTGKTPDEIYATGLSEVARIRKAMDSVKAAVGFSGDLTAFFQYMRSDKKFTPFKTPDDVLTATRAILTRIQPNVKKMFSNAPKSPFEVRQTEAFRAASASAEYIPGSPDGKRPGIYYIPILDAAKFNTTSGMESTFLHEAIPGHHYQISLQQEATTLPKFRRFAWYGAYGEGWALYCESLGKELGLYTDPYQYMGALGDEAHRAIRLVVDVAMHTGKMTREEAIAYMMQNEAIDEGGATAEIERYMAIPAQALSYKIGALKIAELRNKYARQLGSKFSLAAFHDEFLKDGCLPLEVAEKKMDRWAAGVK